MFLYLILLVKETFYFRTDLDLQKCCENTSFHILHTYYFPYY